MPASKPPFVGIGWDMSIGWYAWFGHPPHTVRVPLQTVAKPLKAAGRTMAANPIYISGAVIVGLMGALVHERQERNKLEEAHVYESARANLAEEDRDLARRQAEAMERERERGHEMALDISGDHMNEVRKQCGINSYDRNIAVCGRVSTGKSAFVNAIRGLLSTSPDAAPIGNEETTTEMRPYRDPYLPDVVWWDIPGAGGLNSREWDYYSQQCLFAFDLIIIVHDQVFSQTECNIYRSCIENGKEVLIVRTQSDNNMSRVRNENPNLDGIFLINRYVLESIRATESFLDNAELPRPPDLYHVTANLLMRTRDRSHILPGDPLLQDIDEFRLLVRLEIPRVEESDGDIIADELEDSAASSDVGTDEN